jgi:hypothetical protein
MAKETYVISHWSHLYENFETPTLAFYESVEAAVLAREVPEAKRLRIEHKEAGLASAKREYLRIHRGKQAFDICAAPFGKGFFFSWWFTEPPLRFGIFYTLGFFLGVLFFMNFAFGLGAAVGALMQGFLLGTFVGVSFAFMGVPAILWLLGSAMREGKIAGESTVLAMPLVGGIYEWIFAPPTYYAVDTALMFQEAINNAFQEVIQCVTAEKGLRALTEAERKPIMKKFGPSA